MSGIHGASEDDHVHLAHVQHVLWLLHMHREPAIRQDVPNAFRDLLG